MEKVLIFSVENLDTKKIENNFGKFYPLTNVAMK